MSIESEGQVSPEELSTDNNDPIDESPGTEISIEQTSDSEPLDASQQNDSPESTETPVKAPAKRKRRRPKTEAVERNLLGRRALCKEIADIAPHMLKTVKLRILSQYLDSTKGLDDEALAAKIQKEAKKISAPERILGILQEVDTNVDRRNLKEIIIYSILLQEENHSLEESKLEEKVIEFEKDLVKQAKSLDFFDPKKHDAKRWHHYDTYRIVLEAAWRNQDDISHDEALLLKVLRSHLSISLEEHWLIGCFLKRFPKQKCAIHSADEIHEARKQLQKESILWSYRDQNNNNIDVIPLEIVRLLRTKVTPLELQETNYCRMVEHDAIKVKDLQKILKSNDMDSYGNKADLVDRIISSDVRPSVVLDVLDRSKLSEMCRLLGLKSSGKKEELLTRIVDFYDDLTFEERETKDKREPWFNNYELLAARAYSDLRAKKLITKDLDIEHQFERATDFLFEVMLNVKIDNKRTVTKADGRIMIGDKQVILWDCKSVESSLNLQDYLDKQFDLYVRKETAKGFVPLAILVIAPSYTAGSLKVAYQYKAQTNVDVALVHADALKYLADQWNSIEPKKTFPMQLFNRTEVIDKERIEFLLSLA